MWLHVRFWGWSREESQINLYATDIACIWCRKWAEGSKMYDQISVCLQDPLKSRYKTRLKGSSVLLSRTYGSDDRPQSLQQLPQGHLFCLHPQDHPPEGQWKTSCPANRHLCSRKRQLACFSRSTSGSGGWGRRWERGTVATADPAKQQRRKRKADQPRMWRHCCRLVWFMEAGGEDSVQLLRCLAEMEAFKCGVMLPELMKGRCWWNRSDGDSSWILCTWKQNTGGRGVGVMKQQGASFAHSCFSISTHDGANPRGPGRQRGGGDVKVSVAVFTQQQIIQDWHLVEKEDTAATEGEPTPQTRSATDLAGWSRCGHLSATLVCCCVTKTQHIRLRVSEVST